MEANCHIWWDKAIFTCHLLAAHNTISDDILVNLVENDIVPELAKKIQAPDQQIKEFWLQMCSDLAKKGEDTFFQLSPAFS